MEEEELRKNPSIVKLVFVAIFMFVSLISFALLGLWTFIGWLI